LTLTRRHTEESSADAVPWWHRAPTTMAYTVKQVAALSGVSVRTLHFYDAGGLLKPAYVGANGYRYYEEPQLLHLQQILFYRELGFALKDVRRIVTRRGFEKTRALQSHRALLERKLARTQTLIATIDRTVGHLKGRKRVKNEALFEGFRVAAGAARFGDRVRLGGESLDFKLSGQDSAKALCVFEFVGSSDGPRHVHRAQDEWIYIVAGEIEMELGKKKLRLAAGESVFVPRKVAHAWAALNGEPARVVDLYEPAGTIEAFFREVGKHSHPPIHEALGIDGLHRLFTAHGMNIVGPPLRWDPNGSIASAETH
jgi:DNA-binding transcriptional MerR regulator